MSFAEEYPIGILQKRVACLGIHPGQSGDSSYRNLQFSTEILMLSTISTPSDAPHPRPSACNIPLHLTLNTPWLISHYQ